MTENEKLSTLADTIAKHACEVVGRQWNDIHRSALKEIFANETEGMIRIGDHQIPVKVVIESLRADYVERNVKILTEKITAEVVAKAYRAISDE